MTNFVPRMLANGRVCCSQEHALCPACQEEELVNPYAAGIATLRAANATELSVFEERYKSERLRELDAEHAEIYAHLAANPTPRLTTAELDDEYAPPNSYDAGVSEWRRKETR